MHCTAENNTWYGNFIYYIITTIISTTYFHDLPTQTIKVYHPN